MQLPRRVEIARAVAVRHDAARRLPGLLRELRELGIALPRRVDECADRDVVPGLRLRIQLAEENLLAAIFVREHDGRFALAGQAYGVGTRSSATPARRQ